MNGSSHYVQQRNPGRDSAAFCISNNWVPIPIASGEKGPKTGGWQQRTLQHAIAMFETEFRPDILCNVGVLLGAPSCRLVDVDFDCAEAIAFADLFLPPTCTFGRPSRRSSHRLYYVEVNPKQFKDPTDRKMLVEIRSDGQQTVFPGSYHPSGEFVSFEPDSIMPVAIDARTLLDGVAKIAACALVARHWPENGRHEAQLAYAGALLKL